MQTLQSARLTSKPLPLPIFYTNSVNEKLKEFPARPQVKAPGILRQRTVVPVETKVPTVDTNPKTCDVICKFFASQGILLEGVDHYAFKELVKFLDPNAALPDEDEVASYLKKYATTHKAGVNFSKTVGPLSVTIDVSESDEDKFLVFSIHYFEDLKERKNVIYLRKLLLSELDPASFINTIRRAVHNTNYQNVKFSNITCPSDEIYTLLQSTPVAKRVYMCCYQYMTKFVCDVLDIDEFAGGLQHLREFVSFVKETSDHYSKYRRMQLNRTDYMEVPGVDDGDWSETVLFLTKCLVFHDIFNEFVKCHSFDHSIYISAPTFNHLVYLQRLLAQCVQLCRSISAPNSSISQVVFVYSSLKSFITANSMDYRFQPYIRQLVDEAFKDVTDPRNERRYNIATYLDPRYAYRDSVYCSSRWKEIEEWVVDDFVNYDPSLAECYSYDLAEYTTEELRTLVRQEIVHYRTVSFVERAEENECPFAWWGGRQFHFSILSVMSREYLACPAVSIDAASFFTFNGKLEHMTSLYNTEMVQGYLTVGGNFQEFRGRGASENKVTQAMIETLNITAKRYQKESNYTLYTHHLAATEEERDRIITSEFPPMPTVDNGHREYLPPQEDKPPVEKMTIIPPPPYPPKKVPPHRMVTRPIQLNGKELKAAPVPIRKVPLHQGKTLPPLPSTLALKKVVPITDHQATGLNVKPPANKKGLSTSKATSSEEEKPPKDQLSLDREIKEEIIEPDLEKVIQSEFKKAIESDFEKVKEELEEDYIAPMFEKKDVPLIQKTPQKHETYPARPKLLLPVQVRPLIQNIQPHNFVQKIVVGKQNFVPKFPVKIKQLQPLPPPISIRAPIPKVPIVTTVVMPVQRVVEPLKDPKQDEQEKKPGEKILMESDVKLEPLDDFSPQSNYNSYVPPITKVYADVLNERSAAQAFERHRMNMEYQKRKPCNRRCAVCGNLETHDLLKNVTIDNEKLLIMLGCVYRGEFDLRAAQEFMARETKTYICRVHFGETLDEIDLMLDLKEGDSVLDACSNSIQNVLMTAKQLRSHVTPLSLRNMMSEFVDRNNQLRRTKTDHFNENFDFYEQPTVEIERNDVDDETIMPKVYRQPRKQVLEADSHDGTVKVIEQEDFKLPTAEQTEEVVQNPGVCCYCSKRGERNTMLRVPRGEERLARWIEKLGAEFEKRIAAEEENLICRSHFPDNAFSSRGRLLKGMIPVAAPEKVVCTYSIQGNDFIKVREKKSGTDKDARVNLDNNPNGVRPFWINQYAGDSSEEEEPLPAAAPRVPKPHKKSGRPRGRPRGSTKISIQAKLAMASRFPRQAHQELTLSDDDPDFFYDSEYDDFEGPSDSSSEAKCTASRLSKSTSPVDAHLAEDDTDYRLPAHFQPSDGISRKRVRARKDESEEEVEDPTSRRNSTVSTRSASSRQGSVDKDESTTLQKIVTRPSVPRKSADEKDEDYSVESDKPKQKKPRYNVRIGGKFAKRIEETIAE